VADIFPLRYFVLHPSRYSTRYPARASSRSLPRALILSLFGGPWHSCGRVGFRQISSRLRAGLASQRTGRYQTKTKRQVRLSKVSTDSPPQSASTPRLDPSARRRSSRKRRQRCDFHSPATLLLPLFSRHSSRLCAVRCGARIASPPSVESAIARSIALFRADLASTRNRLPLLRSKR